MTVATSQIPIITTRTWVRLGSTRNIPKEVRGHLARVLSAPVERRAGGDSFSPRPYDYQDPEAVFLVQTRDQKKLQLQLTRRDLAEIFYDGRVSATEMG